jgi:hypothetical protein
LLIERIQGARHHLLFGGCRAWWLCLGWGAGGRRAAGWATGFAAFAAGLAALATGFAALATLSTFAAFATLAAGFAAGFTGQGR